MGRIGNTWSMAQASGTDWNTEKLQKYLALSFSRSVSSASRCARMPLSSSGITARAVACVACSAQARSVRLSLPSA